MQNKFSEDTSLSPFHDGEKEMQKRTGMRETMEEFGRRAIRPYMPDSHREFFEKLPFMVIGSVDNNGWPWASVVSGMPGFVETPTPTDLNLSVQVPEGDPLKDSLKVGRPLGLLGIELPTRRRNRVNGRVTKSQNGKFAVAVDQSFGNCPQYIQTRNVEVPDSFTQKIDEIKSESFSVIDSNLKSFITSSDTFFVSSFIQTKNKPVIEGVDISHRGGLPGFVKVEDNVLTIPDYTGNFLFNTMGNFLKKPKAGLVFVDFESGNIVMLTGTVEILWEDSQEAQIFKGAERAWKFTLKQGITLKSAFPFRSVFGEYSPNTELTGTWIEAENKRKAEAKRKAWRQFKLVKSEEISSVIKSFYFEPADGDEILPFEAGQFLTIRLAPDQVRTYTVSSAPSSPYYRISVKKEPNGLVSNYLHDYLKPGDKVEVRAPLGEFFIDPTIKRPAVLMAGGVGITPMISMALHVTDEGLRTRYTRPLTIVHSAQTTEQRAFYDVFKKLEETSEGAIRYFSLIDKAGSEEKEGVDFHATGYISSEMLKRILPLDDYDFFLCGPPMFMQVVYDTLRNLGVRDLRINAEAFGPASLKRIPDEENKQALVKGGQPEEAESAVIRFTESDFEQRWSSGDPTILEVAENHGLTPEYGCRLGSCGSCAAKLKSGSVVYRSDTVAEHNEYEVLICCAVPAKDSETLEIEL